MKMLQNIIILFFILYTLGISGCKYFDTDNNEPIIPAEESYAKGEILLEEKKYSTAAKEFSNIYFQHPGNPITPYAEFMEAYCLYKAKKYLEAIDVIKEFIELHPGNKYLSDAYYLQISCYMNEISDVDHDQESTIKAMNLAEIFIKKFPHSKYINQVKSELYLLQDYVTGHDISIGNYYMRKNDPIAAISRYQSAKRRFPTSIYHAESIYRLAQASKALGIKSDEYFYTNLLKTQYPNSRWLSINADKK